MFWQEETDKPTKVANQVIDLGFKLESGAIPLDHAQVLAESLILALPWLKEEQNAGVHMIHVAASGNGWLRPDDADNEVLCLSKRTRLHIRIPQNRVDDAHELVGKILTLGATDLKIGKPLVKPLLDTGTIFARYIVSDNSESEEDFMQRQLEDLTKLGINVKKMLCGMENVFKIGQQSVHSKSLLLAELTPDESILLQERGLGPLRLSGFGLFNAHKGIAPVMSGKE